MASLSSISAPLIEPNQTLASDWPIREDTTPQYRPTPPISAELLQNARVIHGITSVPNRSELKRNQLFNADYETYMTRLEEAAKTTYTPLELLVDPAATDTENNTNTSTANSDASLTQLATYDI